MRRYDRPARRRSPEGVRRQGELAELRLADACEEAEVARGIRRARGRGRRPFKG